MNYRYYTLLNTMRQVDEMGVNVVYDKIRWHNLQEGFITMLPRHLC